MKGREGYREGGEGQGRKEIERKELMAAQQS